MFISNLDLTDVKCVKTNKGHLKFLFGENIWDKVGFCVKPDIKDNDKYIGTYKGLDIIVDNGVDTYKFVY